MVSLIVFILVVALVAYVIKRLDIIDNVVLGLIVGVIILIAVLRAFNLF
jgi:hypothetical protein